MIKHYLDELLDSSQNVLLLQGPLGEFFTDFAKWLQNHDKKVFKINFNAGDSHFYPLSVPNTYEFFKHYGGFPPYLKQFCQEHHIDTIICFGDNRYYHKIAKALAQTQDIHFWAFEEGYFRPHYVTFEKDGVNAYSPLPKDSQFYLQFKDLPPPPEPLALAKGFYPMAKRAIYYYVNAFFKRNKYQDYLHHRVLNISYYIKLWTKSFFKRIWYWVSEFHFRHKVENGKIDEFFIVPLQVYDDSQISAHTDYQNIDEFISEVLTSFATKAPKHLHLIIKHHPMDRGFTDYSHTIKSFIQKYPDLQKRISYIHDVPMPILLRAGKGMVTCNSTSGLSALLHNVPVKTLGRANYDFAGLTHQGSLDSFWTEPTAPDRDTFIGYYNFHLYRTHINGSFYNKVSLEVNR